MKVNTPVRRWRWLTAPVAAMAAVLLATSPASAGTVQIQDDANVLNATSVQNEAATLPVGVYVWTTTQDAASKSMFDTDVRNKVGAQFPVVIGINTQAHHTSIQIGRRAGLSQSAAISAASNANSSFDSVMRSHTDYTAATVSALDSLRGALGAARGGNGANNGAGAGQPAGSSSSGGGIVFLVVLLVIILIVVFGALRFVRRRRGSRPRMMPGPPMGPGYPGPDYGGPGYGGPGYGQQYGRSGMSAGAAGAMGAVGGGLLGYELGKMEGREEESRDDRYGDQGGQNYDNSGGQGGDWTVGQDSDFGGGGDSGGGGGGGGGDW